MNSIHKHQRAQQRCIPPVVDTWLDQFGEEDYDGHGGVRVYFSHQSIREMEKAMGRHFVRQNRKYLAAYRIESSNDGAVITAGWLTRHLRRK